ncbi:MAG: alpha/beta hydrolase, partial [Pseudomonadota bacterium]
PGHGLTRTPDLDELAPRYFADRVAEVTDRLDIETFTLVGSSMGGNTAWQFALKYPEKLEGLVLVAASGWPREDGGDRPFVFRLLENSFARTLMRDLDMTSFMRSGLQDSFTDISLVTDVMVERYVLLSRAPGHRDAILTLATARDDREVATPETLSAIRVPTLILQGEDDRLVPAPNAAKFQAAIPMAELVRYENVGHVPQEEIPDASAADLKRFLNTRVHSVDATNREDVSVPADSAP